MNNFNNFVRQEMKLKFGNLLSKAVDAGAMDDKTWQQAYKWAGEATPEEISKKAQKWTKYLEELNGPPPEIDLPRDKFIQAWRETALNETLLMDELLGRIYDSINSK
jgi:hypothetical protein